MNIAELRHQKAQLVQRGREILTVAEAENRSLDGAEKGNYEQLITDARSLTERIQRAEALDELGAGAEMRTAVSPMLDPVEAQTNPSVFSTREYRSAWRRWLVDGNAGLLPQEARALSVASNPGGGYLVTPTEIANQLVQALNSEIFIRNLATKYVLDGAKTLGVPKIAADMEDFTVTAEGVAADEDTALAFGTRDLTPRAYTKFLPVSNKLLRAVQGVENVVISQMATAYGRTLEKEYMTGDGTGNCLGVFVADANGIAATSDVTAASGTTVVVDDFIKAKFALPPAYWMRPSTRWVMHPDVGFKIATQREGSGTGQYLWRESTRVGEPDTLLGVPVLMSAHAPNVLTTGQYVAVIGDFSYYWIADSLQFGMRRLEEINALKDETVFLGMLETDGAPTLSGAFRRIKLA